jgi:hypothetical protein
VLCRYVNIHEVFVDLRLRLAPTAKRPGSLIKRFMGLTGVKRVAKHRHRQTCRSEVGDRCPLMSTRGSDQRRLHHLRHSRRDKAAEQFTGVLHGLHMRVLDRAEAVITDDADADRRLKDVHATLHPTGRNSPSSPFQMTEALDIQ